MGTDRSHYDVLGIDSSADEQAIRRAWKVLIQVWHPDRFSGEMREEAERMTSRINEAYHTLRDSTRRAAYDRRLEAEAGAGRAGAWGDRRSAGGATAAATPPRTPFSGGPFAMGGTSAAHRRPSIWSPDPPVVGVHGEARSLAAAMNEAIAELWGAVQRYPRITAIVAAVWVAVFGGGLLMHVVAGPSLPAGASKPIADYRYAGDGSELAGVGSESSADDVFDAAEDTADPAFAVPDDLPTDQELGLVPEPQPAPRPLRIKPRAQAGGTGGGGTASGGRTAAAPRAPADGAAPGPRVLRIEPSSPRAG